MTELQKAAAEYAKYGFYIFPCKERGKAPLLENGVKGASNDPMQIEQWWQKWPNANIGLAAGANNLIIIDLDIDENTGANGFDSIREWQESHGSLPDTCMSITGSGGYHWLYRSTEIFKNKVKLIDEVDIRSGNGYIIAPPSVHPSGNKYQWEVSPFEEPIAQIDDVVRELLSTGEDIKAEKYKLPQVIKPGERNISIFKFACSLQAQGASDPTILAACISENKARCTNPLTDEEVNATVTNVIKNYTKGESILLRANGDVIAGAHEPIMERNEKGAVLQKSKNAEEAIEFDAELYGKFKYNVIAYSVYVFGPLPWNSKKELREFEGIDLLNLKTYIENKYGIKSKEMIYDALQVVANHYRVNPVKDLLESIHSKDYKCDGAIRKLLPKYLGADDTDYTYEVMKVFMLGAISRAYRPGCKFDYMVVLTGDQGIGKSAFFKFLSMAGNDNTWYDDNFNTIEGKTAAERLRGKWIVEMAELLATKKAKEVESIKAFTTSTVDTYRVPYNPITESRPRVCVFAGTTNDDAFLTDRTGNRRFLPIKVHREKQIIHPMEKPKETAEDVLNAWAEAMNFFYAENMEPDLRLPKSVQAEAEAMQAAHTEEDPLIGIVSSYLEKFDIGEKICAAKILVEAVGLEKEKVERKETKKIHTIMQNMPGWEKYKKVRFESPYGVQEAYIKVENIQDFAEESDETELPM